MALGGWGLPGLFKASPEMVQKSEANGKLTTSVALAHEARDEDALRIVQANWRETAADFWRSLGTDSPPKPFKKLHRMKTLRWLAATWWQLVVATGSGWLQFALDRDIAKNGNPLTWKSLTLTIDQGSDGWSAAHFLCARYLNVVVMFDQSHRTWNDTQLAISDCSWWSLLLLLVSIMNLDYGPWAEERWYHETKESAKQYLEIATHRCAIFQGSGSTRRERCSKL